MIDRQTIWDKIDYALIKDAQTQAPNEKAAKSLRQRFWRRTRWILLDALSSVVWLYLSVKIFVWNPDSIFISHWGWASTLSDYRFFVFLGSMVALCAFWRKRFVVPVLYVFFFPFIILFWKIPRFVYKRKSWNFALGVAHIFFAGFWGLKRFIYGFSAFAFACLMLSIGSRYTLPLAALLSTGLIGYSILHAFKESFKPAAFIEVQAALFKNITRVDTAQTSWRIKPELLDEGIEKFDRQQIQDFATNLGNGISTFWMTRFWAFKLAKYKQSPAFVVFSGFSVAWLVAIFTANLTILNAALHEWRPEQYSVDSYGASMARFVYYSLSSLYINEITGLTPVGDIAVVLKIAAGVLGGIILTVFLISIYNSFKQEKNAEATDAAIRVMIAEADAFEAELEQEYAVTLAEAMNRLRRLKKGVDLLVDNLSREVSAEFLQAYRSPISESANPDSGTESNRGSTSRSASGEAKGGGSEK